MEQFTLPDDEGGRNSIDRLFMRLHRLPESDSFLLKLAILALVAFALWFAVEKSTESQIDISSEGGGLTEGVVGTPRFVNPVLAVTKADRDMSMLVYDGLMRLGPDGVLVPNVADSVTLSEDGLTYNVTVRRDVTFHDGAGLTAADVIFTVSRIQDPALGSPLRANFDGITVEQLGEYELNFVLPEPYTPFVENLTFGILPRHIWKDASNEEFPFSQHNSEPIGSGPYMVSKINRNTSGIPESYVLKPHQGYHLSPPKIESLTLRFFGNEERLVAAFNSGQIDSCAGIEPDALPEFALNPDTHSIVTIPLPRTFALFFNQNKSAALRDDAAREALNTAINREALIDTVLNGYGNALHSPIPPGFGIAPTTTVGTSSESAFDSAREILREGGWQLNNDTNLWEKDIDDITTPLAFSIATVNNAVFEKTAEFLRHEWERLGVSVTVKQFEQSDLTQAIIRPRDYEALLFGTAVGRSLDFYSFWHSSQRNDPGLNVALYANITTDAILNDARTSTDSDAKREALLQFVDEVDTETPAIFLYSPELIYILPNRVTGATFTGVADQSERFASIHNWFINTESVWPIFQ